MGNVLRRLKSFVTLRSGRKGAIKDRCVPTSFSVGLCPFLPIYVKDRTSPHVSGLGSRTAPIQSSSCKLSKLRHSQCLIKAPNPRPQAPYGFMPPIGACRLEVPCITFHGSSNIFARMWHQCCKETCATLATRTVSSQLSLFFGCVCSSFFFCGGGGLCKVSPISPSEPIIYTHKPAPLGELDGVTKPTRASEDF